MIPFELVQKFLLTILLGALIGIEREKRKHKQHGKDFTGIRTFMLTTLLGTLSAYISDAYYSLFIYIIVICFVVIMLAGYILSAHMNKDLGLTTELSTIVGFIIGILCYTGPATLAIMLAILTTFILSLKTIIHSYVQRLKLKEIYDGIKFLIIAFIILPLLPNRFYGPLDAFNPYEIWLMVVLVSGIGFFGYMANKYFGSEKGTGLTGLLGAFASSTAVVTSMAQKSKEGGEESTPALVFAAAVAASTMFLKVILIVFLLNRELFPFALLPMAFIALVGYVPAVLLWRKNRNHSHARLNLKTPLSLGPALQFGLLFSIISFISKAGTYYLGAKGLLLVSFITGFADVDAITIYISRNALSVPTTVAITAMIIAATSNTIYKIIAANIFGSNSFRRNATLILGAIVLAGALLAFTIGKI